MYEIIDENGVIYSGDECEMMAQFELMCSEDYEDGWDGDLKLVHVIDVTR